MTDKTKPADGLGLGKLTGLNLSSLLEANTDKYQEIPLDDIVEDGENPRGNFDPQTLEELASTIRARGVITPISVRPSTEGEGKYIINHGHRRFRASKLAGRPTIPAIVDESFQDEDRIIENIQRDNLDMFEVARYILAKLGQGIKQKEIAARIGKSAAYVSNHAQLLDLPPATAKAVEQGTVTDLTAINELAKAEKKHPAEAAHYITKQSEVTRSEAQALRTRLSEPQTGKVQENASSTDNTKSGQKNLAAKFPSREPGSAKGGAGESACRVVVLHGRRRGVLVPARPARNEKHVWVVFDNGEEMETHLAKLRMVAVERGN